MCVCMTSLLLLFLFLIDSASVLEYLIHHVQCRGLFSTHYHRLAVDCEKDTKVFALFVFLLQFILHLLAPAYYLEV
jgi:hypothetical protein